MSELHIDASDGGKSARTTDALEILDASIALKLQAAIDVELAVHADEAQAQLRAMPTTGSKSTGLRDTIADGVKITSTRGVTNRSAALVYIDVGDSIANIPAAIETSKGWNHPVFGNRKVWATQTPQYRWFSSAMEKAEAGMTARFLTTLEAAAERIARA